MKIPTIDKERITQRAFELLGGRDAFFAAADKELKEVQTRWNQNVDTIGRILRAHLFVEHYLTEYLSNANPRLGDAAEARLTFAQKVALLDSKNRDIFVILPGIKRLNTIRNRLAHNLNAQVTNEDASVFLKCERFAALRAVRASESKISTEPIDVLEDFARHISVALTYEFTPVSRAIAQAISESHGQDPT